MSWSSRLVTDSCFDSFSSLCSAGCRGNGQPFTPDARPVESVRSDKFDEAEFCSSDVTITAEKPEGRGLFTNGGRPLEAACLVSVAILNYPVRNHSIMGSRNENNVIL